MFDSESNIPAVILSAGSEVVTVAIVDELHDKNIPILIISLGKKSILEGSCKKLVCCEIDWPPKTTTDALKQLVHVLDEQNVGIPRCWPVFATEDGSLRLLLEGWSLLSHYLEIPGYATKLKMGGFDKAELFLFLKERSLNKFIPETYVVKSDEEIDTAVDRLGKSAICKPSIKPYSVEFTDDGSKVYEASQIQYVNKCGSIWGVSESWIFQEKLNPSEQGEAVWWGVRDRNGKQFGATAFERIRYPKVGGTACYIEIVEIPELHLCVEKILSALNYVGHAELAFLLDTEGRWRLIEINIRSWLNISLANKAGYPVVYAHYLLSLGHDLPNIRANNTIRTWVSVERLLVFALSVKGGGKLMSIAGALRLIMNADEKAIYSSSLRYVRFRWILKMFRKILG